MLEEGARVMNLLTKGSIKHLTHQLKKKPEEHFADISNVIQLATQKGLQCNVYLEDWSNGMRNSKEYVLQYLDFLQHQPIKRVLLPDTLGVLIPSETFEYVSELVNRYPQLHFDFHAHNDYDLSIANVLEAVKAGAHGLHLTVNGMGERVGNAHRAPTRVVCLQTEVVMAVGRHEGIGQHLDEPLRSESVCQDSPDPLAMGQPPAAARLRKHRRALVVAA